MAASTSTAAQSINSAATSTSTQPISVSHVTIVTSPSAQSTPGASLYTTTTAPMSTQSISASLSTSVAPLLHVPNLTQEDVNRFKNRKACDKVIPYVFQKIISWGCCKPDFQSYLDFLKQKVDQSEWNKYLKKWTSDDKHKLAMYDCNTYDVTLLFKLIPEVCSLIARGGSAEYMDEATLEGQMKVAKDIRNSVMHEPLGAGASPTIVKEVEEILGKILESAGVLYAIDQADIDDEVAVVKRLLCDVDNALQSDTQKAIAVAEHIMLTKGVEEVTETWTKYHTILMLPFSKIKVNRKEVFHETRLLPDKKEGKQAKAIIFPELLDKLNDSMCFCKSINIEGEAGSGKTSLFMIVPYYYPGLILHMKCRDGTITSASHLVKHNFPKTTKDFKIDDLMTALQNIPVLIMIDGIDEWNNTSRKVVQELLNHFKHNNSAKFLISSRPNASGRITQELEDKGLEYETLRILSLTTKSEQIEFLERYERAMDVKSPDLTEAFISKRQWCSDLKYPVYLALFCELYKDSPDNVRAWTSGLSIMNQVLNLTIKMMTDRLSTVMNPGIVADKILKAACDLSLHALRQSNLVIEESAMKQFETMCYDKISHNVDYIAVLSCIFTSEDPCYSTDNRVYTFFHLSYQEFLASRAFLSKLRAENIVYAWEVINLIQVKQEVSEERPSNNRSIWSLCCITDEEEKEEVRDLEKFLNMLRFAILALVTEESKDMFNRLIHPLGQITSQAGADGPFWLEVESSCPGNVRVSMQAAKYKVWFIKTNIIASAAARCLLYCQPSEVSVSFPATEETPAALPAFLQAVTARYEGELRLQLHRSHDLFQPCDKMLGHLGPGRWQLKTFQGCVSSVAACEALAAGQYGVSQSVVHISVPEPRKHGLSPLRGAHMLYVTVRHCAVEPSHRCPLPNAAVSVSLTVIASPAGADEAVANLVMSLAPSRGYFRVLLQACLLTNAELTNVARALTSVMTFYRSPKRTVKWKEASRDGDGRCEECREAHQEARRCVSIKCQ